jgi:glyoxylase-like metal-dependent hydrolase (beta-lactamase superfamily II)
MQVAPGVHHFDTGPFNWYLIEDGGRLTVVDAGFPAHYRVLMEGLRSLGRTTRDVEAIILTHAHADHTGFAGRLSRETGKPVYIHRDDRPGLARPLNLPWYGLLSNAWRGYMQRVLLHATFHGVFWRPAVSDAIPFDDADTLDVPGRPTVLHLPGHTPGEVAFFLPSKGVLFSGDALITRDLMTGRDGGPQLAHRLLNANAPAARDALDRLRELGRITVLPGHGPAWMGEAAEAIELARAKTV